MEAKLQQYGLNFKHEFWDEISKTSHSATGAEQFHLDMKQRPFIPNPIILLSDLCGMISKQVENDLQILISIFPLTLQLLATKNNSYNVCIETTHFYFAAKSLH